MKRTFFAGLAMAIRARSTKPTALIGAVAVGVVLALTGPASANVALNQISEFTTTTELYTHVSDRRRRELYFQAHPHARRRSTPQRISKDDA